MAMELQEIEVIESTWKQVEGLPRELRIRLPTLSATFILFCFSEDHIQIRVRSRCGPRCVCVRMYAVQFFLYAYIVKQTHDEHAWTL